MSFLLGVLVFVVALLFSVMLHEAGHFLTAKRFGMKVTQFFVGFGNTLWSRQRGETEYGVKAIPAGGFVRITGMTGMEEVDPADEPRAFRRHSGWQRLIVLGAGSFMHFVLAFVLLALVALVAGVYTPNPSAKVGAIAECVPKSITASCVATSPKSPAWRAGIRDGDTIVGVAGTRVHNWNQMGKAISDTKPGHLVPVVVIRHGRQLTLHAAFTTLSGRKGSFLGVSPVVTFPRPGPLGTVAYAASGFKATVTGSFQALEQLPKSLPYLFARNRAATPGGNVSSVVGVADITGQTIAAKIGWQQKVAVVLLLIASLNIFVGIFNLLPLLPLDGGHMAVVIYERARSWLARLLHRPDPGLVDFRKLVPVSVGVFALLVAFGLLLIMADIVNPVQVRL